MRRNGVGPGGRRDMANRTPRVASRAPASPSPGRWSRRRPRYNAAPGLGDRRAARPAPTARATARPSRRTSSRTPRRAAATRSARATCRGPASLHVLPVRQPVAARCHDGACRIRARAMMHEEADQLLWTSCAHDERSMFNRLFFPCPPRRRPRRRTTTSRRSAGPSSSTSGASTARRSSARRTSRCVPTARGLRTGVYMGWDGDRPTRCLDALVHEIDPGTTTTIHRHSWDAILFMVEGSGWTEVDGVRYDWKAWDAIHIPAWSWHRHGNDGERPGRFMSYSSEPTLWTLGMSLIEDAGHEPFARLPPRPDVLGRHAGRRSVRAPPAPRRRRRRRSAARAASTRRTTSRRSSPRRAARARSSSTTARSATRRPGSRR